MSEEIKADAFEAALAASASEIATPVVEVVEEIVAEVVSSTEPELALASDEDGDIESDENDQMQNSVAHFAQRWAIGM